MSMSRKLVEKQATEQAEVLRLRDEGKTLQEIANHFQRSVYWVNARLNSSYQPKRLRKVQDGVQPLPNSLDPSASSPATVPPLHQGTRRLQGTEGIPPLIMSLMTEIYLAVEYRLYTLAAMGIRAILENVMKEKVGDRPFKALVNEFQKAGYMSVRQAMVLEVIIEAGHAAIHRAWKPTSEDISTLLNITETLIEIVYLHDDQVLSLGKRVPPRRPA